LLIQHSIGRARRPSRQRGQSDSDDDEGGSGDEEMKQESDADDNASTTRLQARQGIVHTGDLPEEWKEIEEEESETALAIFQKMGPLAVLIYRRIVQLKILSALDVDGNPWNFLKPVLDYYEFYSAKFS